MTRTQTLLLAFTLALVTSVALYTSGTPSAEEPTIAAADHAAQRSTAPSDASTEVTLHPVELADGERRSATDDLPSPPAADSALPPVDDASSAEQEQAAELESLMTSLRSGELTASQQSKAWQRLAELGLASELIEQLRAELEDSPMDADLHAMLGNALITKMRSADLSPAERRETSAAAMSSFDKSLEIDPQNWTARFSRAMSNSSAPAFLGLQGAAIEDFETLLAQQKGAQLSDDHAHTYFFLGNLHEASGSPERAAEVRGEARELFPADPRFER